MTRPTARVLALLEILQGGGTHTAADLAVRLAVDERTVRRYAEHLLDLEVPVESVRGRYGGYRLAPGFRMPPLMLTDEEALAVLLGLMPGRGEAARTAAAKVRRVLPKALAARLSFIPAGTTTPPDTAPSTMLRLAEATSRRQPALISYADRTGRRSERTLHPYGMVARSGRWYVIGADSASGETRTFRLDRIAEVRIRPGSFEVPDDFSPVEEVSTSLAATPWRHEVVVAVRATADDLITRLPRGIATIEPHPDHVGWLLVRLRAERLDWLPGLLAGLDLPFAVQQPSELRDRVRAWAARVTAYAAATSPEEAAGSEAAVERGAERVDHVTESPAKILIQDRMEEP